MINSNSTYRFSSPISYLQSLYMICFVKRLSLFGNSISRMIDILFTYFIYVRTASHTIRIGNKAFCQHSRFGIRFLCLDKRFSIHTGEVLVSNGLQKYRKN